VFLFWLGLAILCSVPLTIIGWLTYMYFWLCRTYLPHIARIFQEKPLFIIPRGQPMPEAQEVRFPTTDGLMLSGCYLATPAPRRGVILFGPEFGSNCWSCRMYCEHLVAKGFDVFAFESRNQGSSDSRPGYDPLQWVTEYEVHDARAALAYLKGRPDADPRGVGFFGISKGAGAGVLAASSDPYVRCVVTDGMFATYTTVVPYMRQWFHIYNTKSYTKGLAPSWYYGLVGMAGIRLIERQRRCRFVHLEPAMRKLAPRPLLMIHGADDSYIKKPMAQALFDHARPPREFWLVAGAKHNQALHVAGEEYRQRVLLFFQQHLAGSPVEGLQSCPASFKVACGGC
jgi:alpha-beta hydrolase superfamily lysophospholipase